MYGRLCLKYVWTLYFTMKTEKMATKLLSNTNKVNLVLLLSAHIDQRINSNILYRRWFMKKKESHNVFFSYFNQKYCLLPLATVTDENNVLIVLILNQKKNSKIFLCHLSLCEAHHKFQIYYGVFSFNINNFAANSKTINVWCGICNRSHKFFFNIQSTTMTTNKIDRKKILIAPTNRAKNG